MNRNSNHRLLVDSGFFFALFNRKDQHHKDACEKQEWLDILAVVMPWPTLYETVNTRFMRQRETMARMARFESIMRAPGTEFLDDSPYRLAAYNYTIEQAKTRYHDVSLVDSVLYAILDDVNVRIDAMLTFNHRDFADVCRIQNVELL